MKREFLQNIRLGEEPLPKEVIDAIMAENGKDIELAKGAASACRFFGHHTAKTRKT